MVFLPQVILFSIIIKIGHPQKRCQTPHPHLLFIPLLNSIKIVSDISSYLWYVVAIDWIDKNSDNNALYILGSIDDIKRLLITCNELKWKRACSSIYYVLRAEV